MAGVDASAMWELVSSLQGLNGSGGGGSTEQATCTRVDNDGTVWVRLLGAEIDTPVNGQRLADVVAGDNVTVTIEDGLLSVIGNSSRPSTSASHVEEVVGPVVQKVTEVVSVVADKASVGELQAATARIGELEADHVAVDDLTAVTGRIQSLESDHVSVADFQAEQANIDTLQANTADIDTIRANSAKVQNLTAAQLEADHATIGTLDTTYATIANLNAANGRITNLESTKANISDLEANYITADEIEATYMHANMSNSDVAWIENGTIKNGAIVSAMINDVSANKLTAGTINGSVINVTNLNADNITTGTINGQRIGEGSLSLSKLDESVYTEAEVNSIVEGLNDRIDGAIETYTGTVVPTLNNSPASSWNTTKLKDEHVGDVYYVVNSQSQQNGYCYRFTKSGNTYSWQLIKDSDVTAALSRLTTAEGKITSIESFDSTVSSFMTNTDDELTSIKSRATSLETRMTDAEGDISDKVDTSTFNTLSQTVDTNTASITSLSSTVSQKADGSTVTALTNRVSTVEQDVDGIETSIGELQTTVSEKADSSTVTTVSNRLNTVSQTVDGHTQSITSLQSTVSQKADGSTVSTLSSKVNTIEDTVDGHTSQLTSITSTQTSMQSTLDKTVKSSIQLWYSKANTTAPSKPTSQVTSTSTAGNAWRIVVPAYNASYPNYYYCWQYEYVDGTYGWSAVVRDIAMGESQATARTADSNASAAVTTANTASTNASTALTTANTANTNASEAKTTATTASTTASEAKTTAETAASDASTAKTNAASAVTTANSASTTATNAQSTANANIKSSVQLWFTKANSTAPNKPTSVVSTSNANTANAWNLVVPVWNSSYPHYFYCYQQQKGDGTYQWTDVVYDRATSEAQQLANTTSTNLSTLQTNYATFKQTTEQFESTVGSRLTTIESDIDGVEERVSDNETSISNNASAIALKANSSDVYTKTAVDGKITQEVTDRNAAITAKANEINLEVSKKVGKDEVISSINLTEESATINASKINLVGAVTIGDLASATQDAVLNSNVQVGGRNYAKTLVDIGTSLTANGITMTVIGPSTININGTCTSITASGDWFGGVALSEGTYSIWLTDTKGGEVHFRLGKGASKTHVWSNSGDYSRESPYVFTVTETDTYWIRVVCKPDTYDNFETRYVIERGNKATDWTPAPEDQTAYVDDSISSIQVGGRNLLKSSDAVHTPANYNAYDLYLSEPIEDGVPYVIQLWDVDVSHTGKTAAQLGVNVYYCGGSVALGGWTGTNYFTSGHADHLTLYFTAYTSGSTVNSGGSSAGSANALSHFSVTNTTKKYIRLYNSVPAADGTRNMSVGLWKLEKGNKPTDWTAAPEDVDSSISEAAQTATNYIVADSSGIKIADANPSSATTYLHLASTFLDFIRGGVSMLKAWLDGSVAKVRVGAESGFNTLTDNEGIKLRNGTTVLGQFATNLIELGKNSTSAVIKLCGGNGKIEYDPNYNNGALLISNDGGLYQDVLLTAGDDATTATVGVHTSLASMFAYELVFRGDLLTFTNFDDTIVSGYTIPVADVINAIPVTLYDNASASASAAATLSETAANFKRLTIFYKDTDNTYGSVDVWNPNGKRVSLDLTWINGASTQQMYQRVRWVTISGTTISTAKDSGDSKYRTGQVRLGGTYSVTNSDYISIVHVIGYR